MLNDARVVSACLYVRTCQRVRDSKNIASYSDFQVHVRVNSTKRASEAIKKLLEGINIILQSLWTYLSAEVTINQVFPFDYGMLYNVSGRLHSCKVGCVFTSAPDSRPNIIMIIELPSSLSKRKLH